MSTLLFDPSTGIPLTNSAEEIVAQSWRSHDSDAEQNFRIAFAVIDTATESFAKARNIGGGGSCQVFRASIYGVPVAVKALNANAAIDLEEDRQAQDLEDKQFVTEMKLLQSVQHPNICRLLAVSVDGPKRCLILPLCTGGTLNNRLKSNPPLTSTQRLQVMVALARVLVHLHSKKLIHRDVKTQNVLLARADRPYDDMTLITKLADFGTVREDIRHRKYSSDTTVTGNMESHASTKQVIGTTCYMSYEYMSLGQVSEKLDAFAAGIVFLELLTGLTGRGARALLETGVDGCDTDDFAQQVDACVRASIATSEKNPHASGAPIHPSALLQQLARVAEKLTAHKTRDRSTVKALLPQLEQMLQNQERELARQLQKQQEDQEDQEGDDGTVYASATSDLQTQTERPAAGHMPDDFETIQTNYIRYDEACTTGGGGDGMAYFELAGGGERGATDAAYKCKCSRRRRIAIAVAVVVALAAVVGLAVGLRPPHHTSRYHPTGPSGGTPTPSPPSPPTHAYGQCNGSSTVLPTSQCNAWQDLWRGTGGGTTWHGCRASLLDPCGCEFTVTCRNSSRGTLGIARLEFYGYGLTGSLPASLAALEDLVWLQIQCNELGGHLPPALNYTKIEDNGPDSCGVGGPTYSYFSKTCAQQHHGNYTNGNKWICGEYDKGIADFAQARCQQSCSPPSRS